MFCQYYPGNDAERICRPAEMVCEVAIAVAVAPAGSLRSGMGTCSACWLKVAIIGDVGSRCWRRLKDVEVQWDSYTPRTT